MNYQETIQLPFELKNKNDGQGHHWGATAAARKKFEKDLFKLRMIRSPFLFPVKLTITRGLGKGQKLWDNDSIGRGNAKQLIDALVASGWFCDDSPKYITDVDYRQDECRRSSGPFIEVTIEQSGESFKPAKGGEELI